MKRIKWLLTLPFFITPPLFSLGCADITAIEDGATYGPVTVLKDWFTSVALVRSGNENVLIDAGYRSGAIENHLEDHNLKPDDIDKVFMTHGHGDHVGGLGLFENSKIYALESERSNLEEEGGRMDYAISDGDEIPVGDTTIKVFSVPGHTDGTAVYLIDGVLLLGDAALINKAGKVAGVPEGRSDDPALAAKNLGQLARSFEENQTEIKWLVPLTAARQKGLHHCLSMPLRWNSASTL